MKPFKLSIIEILVDLNHQDYEHYQEQAKNFDYNIYNSSI